MKINLPFVANRNEKIDFKTFCEGGSPEYVAAKKRLKKTFHQQQQNSTYKSDLLFKIGMQNKNEKPIHSNNFRSSFPVYSLYINPLALIDVNFLIAAGCVVLIAIAEKKLAEHGIIAPAAILSGALKIGFPIVAFGSILILISKLGVFL